MAVERRDPVPAGRYWVFLKKEEIPAWQSWVKNSSPNVAVVASETQFVTPDGMLWAVSPESATRLDVLKEARGEWILFDVKAPTPWVGFGFPTIADGSVKSSTDVITAPSPEPDVHPSEKIVEAVKTLVFWGGAIYLGGVLLSRKGRK